VQLVRGDNRATLAWADRAIEGAADLGVDAPVRALGFRGYARCSLGDPGGLDDMRAALALAVDRGEGREAAVLYNNLAVAVSAIEGPRGVLQVLEEGLEFSERRGIHEFALAMRAASLDQLVDAGEWDHALELGGAIASEAEVSGDVADLLQVRWTQARVLASRGGADASEAAGLAEGFLVDAARESAGIEDIIGGLTASAMAFAAAGQPGRARELLVGIGATPHVRESPTYPAFLGE